MAVLHHMMVADRVVSLGLLAAGLSHHIRNSLVAVKTFMDLAPAKLQEENVNLDALRNPDFLEGITTEHVQGEVPARVNDLLKDPGLPPATPFHFTDKVRLDELVPPILAALKPAIDARKMRVQNDIPDTLPPLMVDKPRCSPVRVVAQGRTGQPPGSHITLSARAAPETPNHRREVDH